MCVEQRATTERVTDVEIAVSQLVVIRFRHLRLSFYWPLFCFTRKLSSNPRHYRVGSPWIGKQMRICWPRESNVVRNCWENCICLIFCILTHYTKKVFFFKNVDLYASYLVSFTEVPVSLQTSGIKFSLLHHEYGFHYDLTHFSTRLIFTKYKIRLHRN